MASLWMPGAIIVPGHPDKVGYPSGNSGPLRGTVVHSAEGWRSELKRLVQDVNRRASWCFSVLTDGTIWQHYPVDSWLWHSGDTDDDGGVKGNMELGSIEEEGLAGTPINEKQVASTVRVIQFQASHFERDKSYARYPVMPSDGWTLAEHNQISNTFTACPSGRIRWDDILELLIVEEDDMTTYKLFHTWGPARLWNIQYDSDVPMWRRWIVTQAGAAKLIAAHGEAENIDLAQLASIPEIRPS